MADDIDRAQVNVDAINMTAAAVRRTAGPAATGRCLNCGEPMKDGRRWCDADCRDDWERRHAQV